MLQYRVIPTLLLADQGLVKTFKFKEPKYLGDAINIIKIFNDKEVDELILLDVNASAKKQPPQFKLISEIASECFMPLLYGGGIQTLEDARKILKSGVEKISINTRALEDLGFVRELSSEFGSQAVVVSVDIKKNIVGKHKVFSKNGDIKYEDPLEYIKKIEEAGAGELFINSVDRDGTRSGYDIELISKISESVQIPVIACGGAHQVSDLVQVIRNGKASAAAAGSMFVFLNKKDSMLINFPNRETLDKYFH